MTFHNALETVQGTRIHLFRNNLATESVRFLDLDVLVRRAFLVEIDEIILAILHCRP